MTSGTTEPAAAVPQREPPLCGVRVLDLTRVLAGPYCTMILADLGADVVKVEHPAGGDDSRHFGPFLPSGLSGYFASINRGKRSVALDLKQENDRNTFRQLAGQADVLVENYRPGTLAKLGLPPEKLRQDNPRLIVASLSGFGHTGRETNRPAYDIIVQALSGLMSITGEGPGKTVRVGTSIADILTGLYGVIGVLAALQQREKRGQGSVVDLAMLDCTVSALENALCRCSITGETPQPLGSRHPSITPFQAFTTSDGSIVVAAGNNTLWASLCNLLNRPQLIADPRFADNAARTQHQTELERLLNEAFARQPLSYWLQRLQQAGIPAAPIRTLADVLQDDHLRSRGMLHEMQDADGTCFLTAGSPLHLNGAAPLLSRMAPALGADVSAVLQDWLGRTSAED